MADLINLCLQSNKGQHLVIKRTFRKYNCKKICPDIRFIQTRPLKNSNRTELMNKNAELKIHTAKRSPIAV